MPAARTEAVSPPVAGPPVVGRAAAVWLDVLAEQAAWWGCVLLARSGQEGLAVAAPALYVAAHLATRTGRSRGLIALAAVAAAIGFAGDTALVQAGFLGFPESAGAAGWSRPWMAALWASFAVSTTLSLRWLARRPLVVVAALGALAGPLAYAAGARLGALTLSAWAPAAVCVEWLAAAPLLVVCARRLDAVPAAGAAPR